MSSAFGVLVLLTLLVLAAPAPAGESPPASATVLNTKSFWRCHLTWKTEMVRGEAGTLAPVEIGKGKPARITGMVQFEVERRPDETAEIGRSVVQNPLPCDRQRQPAEGKGRDARPAG